MKATGIVRKIDELGRIVIPKEIRKTMKIKTGEPLEIYVEKNGEVILKKYDPLSELKNQLKNFAESLSLELDMLVLIADNREVIVAYGKSSKEYIGQELSSELIRIVDRRNIWTSKESGVVKIINDKSTSNIFSEAIIPIIANSDLVGSIIVISGDANKIIGATELKLLQLSRAFLSRQLE